MTTYKVVCRVECGGEVSVSAVAETLSEAVAIVARDTGLPIISAQRTNVCADDWDDDYEMPLPAWMLA